MLVIYIDCNKTHGQQNIKKRIGVVCFLQGNTPASEFRRWGITQKKADNIQNTAKVLNQENLWFSCLSVTDVSQFYVSSTRTLLHYHKLETE